MSVQALLSYALSVPDLESGRRFYSTFGLNATERGGTLAFRCHGREQDQVLLVEGRRKRLHHLTFGADEAGLGAIRTRMHGDSASPKKMRRWTISPAVCGYAIRMVIPSISATNPRGHGGAANDFRSTSPDIIRGSNGAVRHATRCARRDSAMSSCSRRASRRWCRSTVKCSACG